MFIVSAASIHSAALEVEGKPSKSAVELLTWIDNFFDDSRFIPANLHCVLQAGYGALKAAFIIAGNLGYDFAFEYFFTDFFLQDNTHAVIDCAFLYSATASEIGYQYSNLCGIDCVDKSA